MLLHADTVLCLLIICLIPTHMAWLKEHEEQVVLIVSPSDDDDLSGLMELQDMLDVNRVAGKTRQVTHGITTRVPTRPPRQLGDLLRRQRVQGFTPKVPGVPHVPI